MNDRRGATPLSVVGIGFALAALLGGAACAPRSAPDDTVTVRSALSTVLVTVVDQAGVPQFDVPVMAMRNSGSVEASTSTNANGQASLSLTANPFRFATEEGGIEFYSGAVGHCVTPGCTTATITLSRVDVLVADTNGAPQEGLTVWWETPAGVADGYSETPANGHVLIPTPPGSYRFVTNILGLDFFSGAEGHCTVPGCSSATITTQVPVTVMVRDTTGAPKANLEVYAYSTTDEYAGFVNTDANGVAELFVPPGAHQFYTEIAGNDYVSGPAGHCVIPGCTSASITVAAPVTVTVTDTGGAPVTAKPVVWVNAAGDTGGSTNTNASGVATLTPPLEAVRFRVAVDGTQFFSGPSVHCSQPGCTSATISVSQSTVVTVVDGAGAPISGRAVTPLSDEGITSGNKTTNASGQATFRLPFAHWRFRATCTANSEQFFSGNAGHCFIPGGCLTAKITMPCGFCAGKMNGTLCNDSNPCTGSSTCQSQRCTGGNPTSCPASDQCHDAGACSAETGTCSNPPKANGTSCSDSNGCTQTDTCQAGACVGANAVVCPAANQCRGTGTCNPATGACNNPPFPNGTLCDDGNACTQGDVCTAGTCQGPTAFACQPPDTCHDAGTCNAGTASAQPPSTQDLIGWWRMEGDGADSSGHGNNLTVEGGVTPVPGRLGRAMKFDGATACMSRGVFASGPEPGWDDARMQGATGFTMMAWVNASDQLTCPINDSQGLTIMGRGWDYSMGVVCHEAQPAASPTGGIRPAGAQNWGYGGGWGETPANKWVHITQSWDLQQHLWRMYYDGKLVFNLPFPGTIGDIDPTFNVGCMVSWLWSENQRVRHFNGSIDEVMLYRRPLSPAEVAAYYTAADPCTHPVRPDGSTCFDGNYCTQTDTCQTGTCVGANPVVCPAANQCRTAGTCNPGNGACDNPASPDGTPCNDGNACTQGDFCNLGVCQGPTTIACAAPNDCREAGTCNSTAPSPQPPSTQDLLGWWRLDGDGVDSSGGGHDLTNEGAVPAPGRIGLGMKFDGTSCMTAPVWEDARMHGASGVTMMAWINPSDQIVCPIPAHGMSIMGRGWDYSMGAHCYSPSPDVVVTGSVRTVEAFPIGWGYPGGWGGAFPNQWMHVAITWDHEHTLIFVNGKGLISYPVAGAFGDIESTFAVGCAIQYYWTLDERVQNFKGTIDDVMLYRRVLSPAEIAAYYAASDPCIHPERPNGTTCNDSNACTQTDSCQAGACVGANPVVCTADQCHDAGTCIAGACPAPAAKPDGVACSDGSACTRTDMCQAGACVGANPVVCLAPDGCHTASCDSATGTCSTTTVAGSCSLGAFDYDKAGRLIRDRSAALRYDAYDQLREVLPTASPPPITNLPVEELIVPGATSTTTGHSNSKGHVPVGGVLPSGVAHTLLFKGVGAVEDLNATLGISTNLFANSMNDAGAVAGSWRNTINGADRAFRYDAAGFHDLGNPGDVTFGFDLNDANQVAGITTTGEITRGYRHADATGFVDIGTLGGAQSWGWRIDDLGIVSASAQTPESPSSGFARFGHAALYHDLIGLQDLNSLLDPMGGTTLVVANERRGEWVVGIALVGDVQRAYRLNLSTGALDDIGYAGFSTANSVNAAGDVVGWGYVDAGNTQQAAWILSERTGFAKLNDLIDPASGWDLRTCSGIDDFGDVVGWGYHDGRISAFRLRVPAHSSGIGGPMVAEVHTYGYNGLRTSTTTAPGTANAVTQVWFTQDYTQRNGVREHYVRLGDRLIARVTAQPAPGGGMGTLATAPDRAESSRSRARSPYLVAFLLMLTAVAGSAIGIAQRRRRWVPTLAGSVALILGAVSCGMLERSSNSSGTLDWNVATILTHYFHSGISPGPNLITDTTGVLVEERRYEPFGQPIPTVNVVAEPQNILGKLTDPNTGWSYHGARWMQPQTARWTAPDPEVKAPAATLSSEPWDLNPYQYVRQSPTLNWDPNGRQFARCFLGYLPPPPGEALPAPYKPLVNAAVHFPVDMVGFMVWALCKVEGCGDEAAKQWHEVREKTTVFPYAPNEQRYGNGTEMAASAGIGLGLSFLRGLVRPVGGVINVGGRHETPNFSNLNKFESAGIRNLVEGDFRDIGRLFEANSADQIMSVKLSLGAFDYAEAARGSFKVLKPGGTVRMNVWLADQDVKGVIKAFEDAGFESVSTENAGTGTFLNATKPK